MMDYPYQTAFEANLREQGLAPSTIQGYHDNLTRFFAFLADQKDDEPNVKEITEADLRAFFNALQAEIGITLSTYNKLLSYLNRYFRYLLMHQLITTYPTLPLHGALPKVEQPLTIRWIKHLDDLLANDELHFYVRLTLLLTAHGYQVSEFLQPGFGETFAKLAGRTKAERDFLVAFKAFWQPLAEKQACHDPFLKLRVNQAQPRLSNAGLHKFLKPAEVKLGMRLAPRFLFQSYVYYILETQPKLSERELEEKLHLDPTAINYYQHQHIILKAQGRVQE